MNKEPYYPFGRPKTTTTRRETTDKTRRLSPQRAPPPPRPTTARSPAPAHVPDSGFTRWFKRDHPIKPGEKIGIIIVDVVGGFTTPAPLRETAEYKEYVKMMLPDFNKRTGNGANTFHLAPGTDKGMKRCDMMIKNIKNLLEYYPAVPVLSFIDAHREDDSANFKYNREGNETPEYVRSWFKDTKAQYEYPFPPHCIKGSEEALLDYRLYHILKNRPSTQKLSKLEKDCFSGFISGFHPSFKANASNSETSCNTCRCEPLTLQSGGRRGRKPTGKKCGGGTDYNNAILQWCADNKITHVVVTGICTDICVMHLVHALLNVVNHYQSPDKSLQLKRVYVYEPGTASYDAEALGHPIEEYHLMALKMMDLVGAKIINDPNQV